MHCHVKRRRSSVTEQAGEHSTAATASVGAPRRVLVAEDEVLIRMDLVEMLREEGYEVAGEAADGQEAV
ncbi:MAG: response regulator, partial [Mycobacteriaceae bacterium]